MKEFLDEEFINIGFNFKNFVGSTVKLFYKNDIVILYNTSNNSIHVGDYIFKNITDIDFLKHIEILETHSTEVSEIYVKEGRLQQDKKY